MPLVAARCTKCEGILTVDSAKEAAICEYCGTAFIVEKAITNYNTTINIHESGATIDTLVQHANILLGDGNFNEADRIFDKVLERSPHEHRAYWGKLLVKLKCAENEKIFINRRADYFFERYFSRMPILEITEDTVFGVLLGILNPEFKNAVQFADDSARNTYNSILGRLKTEVWQMVTEKQNTERIRINNEETEMKAKEKKEKRKKRIHRAGIYFLTVYTLLFLIAIVWANLSGRFPVMDHFNLDSTERVLAHYISYAIFSFIFGIIGIIFHMRYYAGSMIKVIWGVGILFALTPIIMEIAKKPSDNLVLYTFGVVLFLIFAFIASIPSLVLLTVFGK